MRSSQLGDQIAYSVLLFIRKMLLLVSEAEIGFYCATFSRFAIVGCRPGTASRQHAAGCLAFNFALRLTLYHTSNNQTIDLFKSLFTTHLQVDTKVYSTTLLLLLHTYEFCYFIELMTYLTDFTKLT
jgi:hypothetical protein